MKKLCVLIIISIVSSLSQAAISFSELETIITAFQQEYEQELIQKNAVLKINHPPANSPKEFWWNLPTVHASYSSMYEGDTRIHFLFLMGGYARLEFMNTDGIIATLCHEIGHGLAGEPYKARNERALVSVEGQADYYAYNVCLPRMFKRLSKPTNIQNPTQLTLNVCSQRYQTQSDLEFCLRAYSELQIEKIYLEQTTETSISFEKHDPTIVLKTETLETYYPSPQCRLDTMIAGILQLPRPACWYKQEEKK